MNSPDFLCIGAQRAGTTWLHKILSSHPDVFLPKIKELHFFDEKPDFSTYEGLGKPGRRHFFDMKSSEHWHWYEEQFKPGKDYIIRGEITPFYATLSDKRVKVIAERLPGVKIIYILRNPVQRAWSGFRLFWFLEMKHHECNLDEDLMLKTIMYPTKLIHGDYPRNIGVYENNIDRKRILYLFYDDIVDNPQQVLADICGHLNVKLEPISMIDKKEKVNKAPELSMPASVEEALSHYYADQFEFIKNRFGRTLVY